MLAVRIGVALALACCPLAVAAQVRVADHGLRTLGLDEAEARIYDEVLEAALSEAPGVALSPAERPDCQGEVACHCRSLREATAQKAVFGNVGRIGALHTFELVLLDRQSCQVENSLLFSEE